MNFSNWPLNVIFHYIFVVLPPWNWLRWACGRQSLWDILQRIISKLSSIGSINSDNCQLCCFRENINYCICLSLVLISSVNSSLFINFLICGPKKIPAFTVTSDYSRKNTFKYSKALCFLIWNSTRSADLHCW